MYKYSEFNGHYSFLIGRFSPMHKGHIKLARIILEEGKKVCFAIRDTPISSKDPYTIYQRVVMIVKEFESEINDKKVIWTVIPDIEETVRGRKAGWGQRTIDLDKKTEKISATSIRKQLRDKGEL